MWFFDTKSSKLGSIFDNYTFDYTFNRFLYLLLVVHMLVENPFS